MAFHGRRSCSKLRDMSDRFYINGPLSVGPFSLDGPEAHHLSAVRRLRPGDAVCLFNGDGEEYVALVTAVGKRSIELDATERRAINRELPFQLEVAAPLPKADRAQFLVEKLTELGVTVYVPLLTERSVIVPSDGKREKLDRYVVEASKQCGRNRLMRIGEPTRWTAYAAPRENEVRLLAHPGGDVRLGCLGDVGGKAIRVGVGPEGGFTDAEIEAGSSWRKVDLGQRILRIESAAIAMVSRITL